MKPLKTRLKRLRAHAPLASLGLLSVAIGCSVGDGEGVVSGTVFAPICDLSGDTYELDPTFFSAEGAEGQVTLRIQRGSDFEDKSDGIVFFVRDVAEVNTSLGEPIEVPSAVVPRRGPLVRATLYLNESCPLNRNDPPVVYEAAGGSIAFDSIYSPDSDDALETDASFDLRFEDPANADERRAQLAGTFRFLFTRGRPAQRFP